MNRLASWYERAQLNPFHCELDCVNYDRSDTLSDSCNCVCPETSELSCETQICYMGSVSDIYRPRDNRSKA
jgi:hypothetical protein